MALPKADLVDGINRLGGRWKKLQAAGKEKAKEMQAVVYTGLGAGAVGAIVGMLKGRDPENADAAKVFNVDVDLLAGAGLTFLGMTMGKQLGKRNAEIMKYAGGGALAYWFGTFMEEKMLDRAEAAAIGGA